MDQSPTRAKRRRLDRKAAGEPPLDVAFGKKGDERLLARSGEQEKIVKAAPPRFTEQDFEKRAPPTSIRGVGVVLVLSSGRAPVPPTRITH